MGWEWPRSILCIDTETRGSADPFDPSVRRESFKCGAACWVRIRDGSAVEWEDRIFDTAAGMREWILDLADREQSLWIFAHNAPFDLAVLGVFRLLFRGELALAAPENGIGAEHHNAGILIPDPPPFALRCWTPAGRRITVLDTHNWLRCPLAEIGELVGRTKGVQPPRNASDGRWKAQCLQDARIVLDAVRMLERRYREEGHKVWPWSPASAAWADWSRSAKPRSYKPPKDPGVKRFERSAYFGGRSEVFYADRIPYQVHALDVNSLYPSVMMGDRFPVHLLGEYPHSPAGWEMSADRAAACIARVRVADFSRPWPVRRDGRTVWACGDFETALAGAELAEGIRVGAVQRVLAYNEYKTADLFGRWIAAKLDLRHAQEAAGDHASAELTKLTTNGLYGKFGRLEPKWEVAGEHGDVPPDEWTEWVDLRTDPPTRTARWGPWEWTATEEREHPKSFPAVAAFVTAAARVRMDHLRRIAGPDGCYYQAVDCLYTSLAGRRRLEDAGEIAPGVPGKLRVTSVRVGAWFRSVNQILHGRDRKVAGIPRHARLTRDWEAEYDRFGGVVDAFRSDAGEHVRVRRVKARLSPANTDGQISVGGWLQPLRITG